jgi:recombination protein RecA
MATEMNKEKLKALQLTMDKMEKTFGKGAIMRMGDDAIEQVETIPPAPWGWTWRWEWAATPRAAWWRSTARNHRQDHPGHPCHRGMPEEGWHCAIIDAEHAFDRTYAESLGVDTENLLISQPDNGEQAWRSPTT